MAIAWEFIIITEEVISVETLVQLSSDFNEAVAFKSIASIDDWNWSNQQHLKDIYEINSKLEEKKIIVVEMESILWQSIGMYIEYIETEGLYSYTFWINAENHPELDVDKITDSNKRYYDYAFFILGKIIKKYNLSLYAIAIGLESNIKYESTIDKMIQNSHNVIVWIVNYKDGTLKLTGSNTNVIELKAIEYGQM